MKLATYNCPYRIDKTGAKYRADIERLIKKHKPWVVALQETTDKSPATIAPKGWADVRPVKARSASLIYDKSKVKVVKVGTKRIHTPDWGGSERYIVWARFERLDNGKRKTIASVHVVAFKTSKPRNGREYLKQQKRVADWLDNQKPSTVILGDWNGTPGQKWMPDMTNRHVPSSPRYATGPSGQKIDYAWYRKDKANPVTGVGSMAGVSDHKMYICKG
jgi:endonuclease/exonuclease/phosphatase family metal-dependent hydrolase